ncbi:MAG: hypothetical protein OXK80_06005 [Bdellovibrionales bacterium]|nr:hypothetical protein [Bdellovibrionales bacterium]
MKNVRTVLALMASVFFLSHCGGDQAPGEGVAVDLAGNDCVAGVYQGEGDIRWNSVPIDQDLVVSVAFQGDSALVKVQGDDGDLLCTQYAGLEVTENEEDGSSVLGAVQILSSRTEGNAFYSDTLADSLLDIQVSVSDENCNFNIGSIDLERDNDENDTLNSANLERVADQQADFNTLLAECGGPEAFNIPLPQEEEEEEVEEETAEEAQA